MHSPRTVIIMPEDTARTIFTAEHLERLEKEFGFDGEIPGKITPEVIRERLRGAGACVTGWGTGAIAADALEAAPELAIIAHSAGSVKGIVPEAAWERGIVVTSAAAAIAVGVAEYTLGLMVMAMKRVVPFMAATKRGEWKTPAEAARVKEFFGAVVGIIGAGFVGRHVMRLLGSYDVEILLYDPFVDAKAARELGARKVDLSELMAASDVVSVHAPSIPETRHMLSRRMLACMKDGAVLVNTARGSIVDEAALIDELTAGRIWACLDVTDPEPPAADSPLRTLPNVILTPHIAGAVTNNRFRQGEYVMEELDRVLRRGEKARYEVTFEMLKSIA